MLIYVPEKEEKRTEWWLNVHGEKAFKKGIS
jgi:hypothetical protein